MTNRELIEKLKELPPDFEVYLLQDEMGYHYLVGDANVNVEIEDEEANDKWYEAYRSGLPDEEIEASREYKKGIVIR